MTPPKLIAESARSAGRIRSPKRRLATNSNRTGCSAAMTLASVTVVSFTPPKNITMFAVKTTPPGADLRGRRAPVPGGNDHRRVASGRTEGHVGKAGPDEGVHLVGREERVDDGAVLRDDGQRGDVGHRPVARCCIRCDEEILAVLHL